VAADFDLNLLPLYRLQGQEMPQIPGLVTVLPPKRCARGREEDHLLIYLTLSGNTRFPSNEHKQIITRLSQRFYQTSGSLTSAIRTASGELNQTLLKRNLHTTGKGEYTVGRLVLGVLRGTQFLFAQCGPTYVFHINSTETKQIHDEQIAGHGLGIGQSSSLYFSQIDLHAGDSIVLCPALPTGWDNALTGQKNVSFETLRRNLLSNSGEDLNAVLVQVQAGNGNINLRSGAQTAPQRPSSISIKISPEGTPGTGHTAVPVPPSSTSPARPTSQVESGRPASRFARLLSGSEKPAPLEGSSAAQVNNPAAEASATPARQPLHPGPAQVFHRPAAAPIVSVAHPVRQSGRFVTPRRTGDLPEIRRPVSRRRREIFGGLVKGIRGVRAFTQRLSDGLKRFLPNLLPTSGEEQEGGGSGTGLFTIIIPVIIVSIAATVYIQYGRTAQYQQYYDMALAQASQARGQTNPTEVRRAWDSAIYYLDLAEKNQKTQDSITLRQESQAALDNLDGILRLDFRQAIIGGLSRSVQISHMAATETDLYLLDAARGSVMRAFLTDQGYQVDPTFKCDPGQYDTTIVDTLVDLEALPMSNVYNAHVLAMDGKGNLLYCGTADPVAVSLAPPQLGWKGISSFSLDADGKTLYVLDPAGNAIWEYNGSFGKFTDLPNMFFSEQVPENMNTAIGLAANNSDLYMLFRDGHVTTCPLTHIAGIPMRCADPATFVDARPERQSGPKINDAIFTQVTFASAPDPSLYMLEPLTRAIYRFSPRSNSLELRGQFRATPEQNNTLFEGPATAMTISPNRYAFFSIGNQVYFATDVP
jgi:hypothetical protein